MGCKQSVAFKETRKVAIERPSPLSFSSFSETPEKHSSRQVTVSQSEKDKQRQNLNRGVTLRGISTSEGVTAPAESHEHESSAPPSLEDHSKATTGTARSCSVSAKPCRRRSGVKCSGDEKFSEQPPRETGVPLCKFPNSRMSACGTQAAFFGEVRHMPSFLGTVQRYSTGEQCHSETPGPENQTDEGGCCISRMQQDLDTDRVLSPHQKKCENPPVSTRSPEEEPQNSEKEGSVARFQVNCTEVSCTIPDIGGAHRTQSPSGESKEFLSLYYPTKQRRAADSWAVRHESLNDGENSADSGERDSSTSNFSFIARPTPCRQPWERDGGGRWSQAGVLPREKLIEVHRTPHSQQSANQGSLSRHFRNPGRSADACPPGTALFGVPGWRQPGGQFFALTEQSQRACRAVALVSKAEQQRRASCGPTAGSYHPTGYVAKSDAVASQFRQLRAQKHTAAVPSEAFSESLPFSRNQRWGEGGRITQGHYAAKWNGEDSGESRGEVSRAQRVRLAEVCSTIADNRHYLRPVFQTGSQWSSASCPEAVQRSIAARRAAKNAFIAPPSTNMGPILQPCC